MSILITHYCVIWYSPKNYILGPVLDTLVGEMRDVCISDCSRVMGDNYSLSEQEIEKYWNRLKVTEAANEEKKRYLSIEANNKECKVGFCVNKDVGCPVNGDKKPEKDIAKTINEVARIVLFRKFGATG